MADESEQSQKTEEPSQKRLQDARERGQVAISRELNHWFTILAATIVVLSFAPGMANRIGLALVRFVERPETLPVDRAGLGALLSHMMLGVAGAVAVPLAIFVAAALLGSVIQSGFMVSFESLKPQLSRLSPFEGVRRLFSIRSVSEMVKGLIKIAIIGVVMTVLLWPEVRQIKIMPSLGIGADLGLLDTLALRMLVGTVAVMTVVAALDLLYQRYELRKSLRMTKQELKDEHKQSEGDPMIKGRIRQLRMERARRRMMAKVPEADVVVTNPTHYAIALKYDRATMRAPIVVAKGIDSLALKIREVAAEHKVPLVENRPLAQVLYKTVDLDAEIPPEHYRAVAQVIAYVMKLKHPAPAA